MYKTIKPASIEDGYFYEKEYFMSNIIRNHNDLRKEAANIKSNMTDEQFFTSPVFHNFMQKIAEAMTEHYNHSITVTSVYEKSDLVAYSTQDSNIVINVNNSLISKLDRLDKFKASIAHDMHECGHDLFSDFLLFRKSKEIILQERKLFPEPECPEYAALLSYLATASDDELKNIVEMWQYINNSIEDGFVDRLIMDRNRGYAPYRKFYLEHQYKVDISEYKEMKNERKSDMEIFFAFILSYAKFGKIKADLSNKGEDVIKKFFTFSEHIDKGLVETNSYFRVKEINEVFAKFFSYVKDELQNQQNRNKDPQQNQSGRQSNQGQGQENKNSQSGKTVPSLQNSAGNSQISQNQQSAISNIISSMLGSAPKKENINHAEKKAAVSDAALGNKKEKAKKSQNNSQNSIESMLGTESQSALTGSSGDIAMLSSLESNAAMQKAQANKEKEVIKNLKQEVHDVPYSNFHSGISSSIQRNVDSNKPLNYEKLYEELMPFANRMSKELKKQIKKRQIGSTMNGLYTGRRVTQPYRFDKKIMSKNIAPEKIPNMAICLLIDESGSMRGTKISTAIKTAFIVYQFCKIMGVPISIYGHSWNGYEVMLHSYAEFNSVDGNDIYRICNIQPGGSNRDGYALKYCSEHLYKQKAENKIMMIISDGTPNSDNYHMSEAIKDIQVNILKFYYKKNIKFITAGIDDQEDIEKIYVNGLSEKVAAQYLNVSNLELLPKEMVAILKKYLEK